MIIVSTLTGVGAGFVIALIRVFVFGDIYAAWLLDPFIFAFWGGAAGFVLGLALKVFSSRD